MSKFNICVNHPELALKNAIKSGRQYLKYPLKQDAVKAIKAASDGLTKFFIDEFEDYTLVSWKFSK